MKRPRGANLIVVASLLVSGPLLGNGPAMADDREDFFEAKIRPVLLDTCFRCHGDTTTSGALRIDSRETLLEGGESGPAIVPGNPEESLLIRAIRRQEDASVMPPDEEKALRPDQVADFVAWVQAGAVWPANSAKFAATTHWAFEPIRDCQPPDVQDTAWGKTSIDAFVLARQESQGVRPNPAADKLTLIRRATFDLTGLPPTAAEVEAFDQDNSLGAIEAVVDRLLASPAYGERWGRHWLDLVRYADTAGETADYPVPLAWLYRNYVIDSFNADKPYDEFLREQIAGDILANQGPPDRYADRVTATGYLAISRRFGFDSENYHHLTIQDTIDTMGQSVLGLSLGCARCHDHKFDAVSMQDYYALYGIFDSTRYAFPGSEQKPKVRAMAPLLPPKESRPKWREFTERVAALASELTRQDQPVPAALLRSLNDIDGDFELQAPAAGGSKGVLAPPWLYEGQIALTNAAQSPFKNLYATGKVGASVAAGTGGYRVQQALFPARTGENCDRLYVNLDFRVAAAESSDEGQHHFTLGTIGAAQAFEMLITSDSLSLRIDDQVESLCPLQANEWHNLQLILDLKQRTISGTIGRPGETTEFSRRPLSVRWNGVIDCIVFDASDEAALKPPTIEFDNLGVLETSIPPVSTESQAGMVAMIGPDGGALIERLRELTGRDGDLEMQTSDAPPATPWNPGPNSVVIVSADSQSPFRNVYPAGELGLHLPNRGAYDGFGMTLSDIKPDGDGRLFVGFDFRCASRDAGGDGSWRYYLGHGPGNSAAVELFFNGNGFFRRSANATEVVCPLVVGQWYQVQLSLDLKAKAYTGRLVSPTGEIDFDGQLASGWDGTIDYTFIDSYGHIGGVRPSLDADNFILGDEALPPLDSSPPEVPQSSHATRREQSEELRRQLDAIQAKTEQAKQELERLLVEGPFAMAYGVVEGTPHDVPMQMRGEPDQPGPQVARGFIRALGGGPLPPETVSSGRLELAQWLTRPDNPLTARVMVNRIWQHHFGRGLVKTPNDFGVRGLLPTHPDLLDHLATQFIRSGWSVKAMHRLIMLSSTYQQSPRVAGLRPSATVIDETDEANLYAAFPRRRLSAEEIRDSILAVSGELDPTPGREHPFPSPIGWGFSQHGPFSAVYDHNQRSVYLMTQRLKRHPFLALFDGPDPNTTTAVRMTTTVPTQALFFLNDPFVFAKAEKWAARLMAASGDEGRRIELAWRGALGRAPTETELSEARKFMADYRAELAAANLDNVESRALAAHLRTLIGSNEFLHVE